MEGMLAFMDYGDSIYSSCLWIFLEWIFVDNLTQPDSIIGLMILSSFLFCWTPWTAVYQVRIKREYVWT